MTDKPMPTTLPEAPPSNVPGAALWMLGALVSFSAMAVAGREAGSELDTFELMTYRSMVGLVIVLAGAFYCGTISQIRVQRMGLHIGRNILHFTGQNLWFWAVTVIPLAHVFALEFTSPLWVIVLAAIFLGERLTQVKIVAGVIGFIGILIVVRPGVEPWSWGMGAAALAAIFFAGTAIYTKKLTRDQPITQILFWLAAIQLVLGLCMSLYDGDMALPSARVAPWVLLIALCGLAAHFCLTTALAFAPASVVMPIDFMRLPLIAFIGMAFYMEPLEPFVFAGAVLIFGAVYLNVWTEHRRSQRLRAQV